MCESTKGEFITVENLCKGLTNQFGQKKRDVWLPSLEERRKGLLFSFHATAYFLHIWYINRKQKTYLALTYCTVQSTVNSCYDIPVPVSKVNVWPYRQILLHVLIDKLSL